MSLLRHHHVDCPSIRNTNTAINWLRHALLSEYRHTITTGIIALICWYFLRHRLNAARCLYYASTGHHFSPEYH